MNVLSFDVGGSKIAFALVDSERRTMHNVGYLPTPKNVEEIVDIFKSAYEKNQPDGVAIATAGIVWNNHLMGKPNNLPAGYEDIAMKKIFPVPFVMENDANAAAWAELQAGALQDVKYGVMLTLGTDVGCSIITNGKLMKGKCGAAGEIRVACSGTTLKEFAIQEKYAETDCFRIYAQVAKGDEIAQKVYNRWKDNLINTIIQINQLLDTEVIALSGSLSKIIDYRTLNINIKKLNQFNAPVIKPAYFSTNAGIIGATLLWKHSFQGKIR